MNEEGNVPYNISLHDNISLHGADLKESVRGSPYRDGSHPWLPGK